VPALVGRNIQFQLLDTANYQQQPIKVAPPSIPLPPTHTHPHPLTRYPFYDGVRDCYKCISWCTDGNDPTVVAGGMASGRVALFRLDDAASSATAAAIPSSSGAARRNNDNINTDVPSSGGHRSGNMGSTPNNASTSNTDIDLLFLLFSYPICVCRCYIIARIGTSTRRVVREFVPKYTRPCNAIAWNKQTSNILAVGLERMRNGHGMTH
jgi:hypothetical protein